MIELQNVRKYYGNKLALNDVSFRIEDASIIGLLGKNGAGKSTLMNIITGYLPATAGNVCVDGLSIDEAPQEVKGKIGYLPEKPPLYDTMSVREFLEYVAKLKGVSGKNAASSIDDIIKRTGLDVVENRLIRNLSKGYQQRVGIAQAMVGEPKILILDEPTVGLDPSQVVEIRALLKEYAKDHVIIISSHILAEIAEICDRILILNQGSLIKDCRMEELNHSGKNRIFVRVKAQKDRFEDIILKEIADCKYLYKGQGELGCSDWEIGFDKDTGDIREEVFCAAAANHIELLQMIPVQEEIEDVFLNLTSAEYSK
ncbi:ABC transporter ATP-binding protein [Faecalicatena contorta]|uniref:ABC transporter ATP-binding protein n=1 Tax=Faecalicatena contorta TaxID=39482 RepID=UPI001F391061|nr:ATP-binding cassette domain-containing protein [Faecalicatena contorta]MCF2683507.1 ATP-binding cassette domain-containing protein [Faecalicatena contorta]